MFSIRKIGLVLAFAAQTSVAFAQTAGTYTSGQTLAASQLNSAQATKQDYNPVLSGLAAGTGTLQLPITGSTQCLHANSSGIVSGTGSDCGSGGGGGSTPPGGSAFSVQYNNAGAFGGLTLGTSGQVLTSGGSSAAPTWTTVGGGGGSPGGSSGQIQYNNAGSFAGLNNGAAAQTALTGLVGTPMFYAANYGVLANGQTLTDVTTTASNTTIHSASYTFVTGDIGKDVTVWAGAAVTGTGGVETSGSAVITGLSATSGVFPMWLATCSNVPAGTHVAGILSSSSVILDTAATASGTGGTCVFTAPLSSTISNVSGGNAVLGRTMTTANSGTMQANFGTDDSAAYQSAIAAASAAGGGTIVMPRGVSMIATSLAWASQVSLMGQGTRSSILRWASPTDMQAPNGAVIDIPSPNASATNPLVDVDMGYFQIDVDAGTWSTGFQANCINLQWTVRWHVHNTYQHGSPASCDRNDYSNANLIDGNYYAHTGRLVTVGNGGNSIGATFAENVNFPTTGIISNNYIYDPGVTGILYQPITGTTNPLVDTVDIVGNVVYFDSYAPNALAGNNVSGIDEVGGLNSIIADNVVIGPPVANNAVIGIQNGLGDSLASGIFPDQGLTITGNRVYGMGSGIWQRNGNSTDIKVSNNVTSYAGGGDCYREAGTATSSFSRVVEWSNNIGHHCFGAGLALSTTGEVFSNTVITGNTFYDNDVGATTFNISGIAVSGPNAGDIAGLLVTNNRLFDDGAATQKYAFLLNTNTVATNVIFQNNILFGNVTAPFSMGSGGSLTGLFNGNTGMPASTISGCSATVGVGTGDLFKVASGTTGVCTVSVTPYGSAAFIAKNGWFASANNINTPANVIGQSTSTTTAYTITSTTVTGDAELVRAQSY